MPEDSKADAATSRELSTANFVGYLRGCEATYTTATQNDIDLADDMSREWWLLECYGRANNWAAPLLQTRVDTLQQTEVTRPVADIFTAHRSAARHRPGRYTDRDSRGRAYADPQRRERMLRRRA